LAILLAHAIMSFVIVVSARVLAGETIVVSTALFHSI
jgi:hypothetical protein